MVEIANHIALALGVGGLFVGLILVTLMLIGKIGHYLEWWNLLRMTDARGNALAELLRQNGIEWECGHWRSGRPKIGKDGKLYRQCYDCRKFVEQQPFEPQAREEVK